MKNLTYKSIPAFFVVLTIALFAFGQRPVNPDASPEAVKLLEYIYSISGNHILTGQHCAPLVNTYTASQETTF
jgi:hypothetical protein